MKELKYNLLERISNYSISIFDDIINLLEHIVHYMFGYYTQHQLFLKIKKLSKSKRTISNDFRLTRCSFSAFNLVVDSTHVRLSRKLFILINSVINLKYMPKPFKQIKYNKSDPICK